MSVGEFYDDTSPEVWKKAIGEDLHYHVGWGEGDILYNAIEYLYPFIGRDSKVLDCGCGWGGGVGQGGQAFHLVSLHIPHFYVLY